MYNKKNNFHLSIYKSHAKLSKTTEIHSYLKNKDNIKLTLPREYFRLVHSEASIIMHFTLYHVEHFYFIPCCL